MAEQPAPRYCPVTVPDVPFDELPPEQIARAFGVTYAWLTDGHGGDLYVTRYGWSMRRSLMPDRWFDRQAYVRRGEKLPGSTGSVYRVPTVRDNGRRYDLVVKFSRVAQQVPLFVQEAVREIATEAELSEARFSSPFEEFGHVMALRRGPLPRGAVRLRTKRPLAIYSPGPHHALWRLGRSRGTFLPHQWALSHEQDYAEPHSRVELDIKRDYILLYEWVKGENAEALADWGLISTEELEALSHRVIRELRASGFQVLDNKPKHFILRPRRRDGTVLRRNGKLVYALVDFELLRRVERPEAPGTTADGPGSGESHGG